MATSKPVKSTNSIKDRVRAASTPNRHTCTIGLWLASLPDDVRAEWVEVYNDLALSHSACFRIMAEEGFTGTRSPVERHRKQECSCRP